MFLRVLALSGGLIGAAGASQFPEFSQQYMQRLGGAVDELSRVVQGFDADAAALGLSRDAALADLAAAGGMAERRAATMGRTLRRHDRLSADLEALRGAGPFTRAYRARHLMDAQIARAAWADFRPALPLTPEGAIFAGAGFLVGLGLLSGLVAAIHGLARAIRPARRSGKA